MSKLFSIQLQNRQQSRDGVWLDLPTTTEQVQAALRQIDISSDNPQGLFISGYFAEEEKRFAIPYNMVLASNVDELNFLASRLETLSTGERAELNAALQAPQSELFSIGRITDFPENVDYYVHLPDVHGPAQLGDYYLNRSGMVDMPEEWKGGIDTAQFGRYVAQQEQGAFTQYGYLVKSGDEWQKVHEGQPVPEEYRVLSFPAPEVLRDAANIPPPVQPETEPQKVIPIILNGKDSAERMKEITDRLETGIQELFDSDRYKSMQTENRILPVCLFLLSLLCIGISAALFNKNGILPSHENNLFQLAAAALVAGTFLLFYSLSAVFMQAASARKCFYLKGLNTFLVRQIGSKIRTNYLVVTVVCGLLTITICAVSIGASTALAMNKMSQSATPYDLNVLSNVSVDGDSDIAAYLAAHDITISNYAKATEQISVYEADMTYSELFEGQKVKFWPIDEKVPDSKVSVISISDLNRALAMQNKAPITLNDGQYLLNCNYNGTYRYIAAALQSHPEITVGGVTLQRAEDKVLQETYIMTSVGNNDRGTLIVPDSVTASLEKDVNALLVQYEPNADSNEILQKMIPIGLDSTHGYRYAEKNMMYETFYGLDALVSFLCCYIGLVFLLICAALLALKQLTETTDNVYRYGLLQKLGAGRRQIDHTLFVQTVVFFAIPLVVAGVYSAFLIGKAMAVVEEFMNIHIATNIGLTIVLFLLVYGSYFLATYLSCKRIVTEQRELEV